MEEVEAGAMARPIPTDKKGAMKKPRARTPNKRTATVSNRLQLPIQAIQGDRSRAVTAIVLDKDQQAVTLVMVRLL